MGGQAILKIAAKAIQAALVGAVGGDRKIVDGHLGLGGATAGHLEIGCRQGRPNLEEALGSQATPKRVRKENWENSTSLN